MVYAREPARAERKLKGIADLRCAICNLVVILACVSGCAQHQPPATPGTNSTNASSPSSKFSATTRPILYHRTGGIAGTDDRVIIWPDGFVEVTGRLLPDARATISHDRLARLERLFDGWEKLKPHYPLIATDAYEIKIFYGSKAVEASDLAPDLPEQFRKIFTEIESIAFAAAQDQAPQAAPVP